MKFVLTLLITVMAWQAHATEINELQRLAATRDPLAQYQLALIYKQGAEVEASPQKAQYWFEQAAELGNIDAQHELIAIYLSDTPSAQDLKEALYWLSVQATSGNEDSQVKLGDFYSQYGEQLDPADEAIAWYRMASAHSEEAEDKYNAVLQAKFDGKRLQRVQQLEQLSTTFNAQSNQNENSTPEAIEQSSGYIQTDIISIISVAVIIVLLSVLTIKRRNKRVKFTGQQRQIQNDLTKQLKASQRTVETQKQQLNKIIKQYKKLQQMSEKKESNNKQQLQNACTLFGCEANLIPDEKTLKLRYRQLSKIYHPDAGGNSSSMTLLNHSLKLLVALSKAQQARKLK